jgi:hypothetical protein
MRALWILTGLFLFTCGLLVGRWSNAPEAGAGATPPVERSVVASDSEPRERRSHSNDGRASDKNRQSSADRDRGTAGSKGSRERRRNERQHASPDEAIDALGQALRSGDRRAGHDALRALLHRDAEPFTAEQLEDLGGFLELADAHVIHDLARALVVGGGEEGLAMVMDFLEDDEQPLEVRSHALRGLANIGSEKASDVSPVLADFLESGAPNELQRAAAQAIGRMHGDTGTGVLLGLLEDRPRILPSLLLDAIGDIGRASDIGTLLGMLSGDGSRDTKLSLLRSAGKIAVRADDPAVLLELLRQPPKGVSRDMVAHAISDTSQRLGASFLESALREARGDRHAQEWIARAMTMIGGKDALSTLLDASRNPDIALDSRVLAHALREFRGPEVVPVMMDLFRSGGDRETLRELARGMLRNGGSDTRDELLTMLESGGDSERRRAIARSLSESSSNPVEADRLLSMLRREQDQEVATSLLRALGRTDPEALERLGSAGSASMITALQGALRSERNPGVRDRIREALRQLGAER